MNSKTEQTLLTISSRIRKSPYYKSTRRYGAKSFTIYNKMYMPTSYTSPVEEYWSLINDVTMWDVSCERQIEITGPGARAQPSSQVDGDHPVRPGRPRRSDFLTDHADAPLQVGERAVQFGGRRSGKQDVGPVGGGGGEQVDGDDRAGTVEGPAGQVMVGNVAQDVGAQ